MATPSPPVDPAWVKIAIALVQSAAGAASALVAVFLTQRSMQKDRRFRAFEKINEPFINAHAEVFTVLVRCQDRLAATPAALPSAQAAATELLRETRERMVWLDEEVAQAALEIVEAITALTDLTTADAAALNKRIVACQRKVKDVLGVPAFRTVVGEMRRG